MEDKEIHAFPKNITPKVNVTARLEFEHANYNVAVQYASYCATRTPLLHGNK